MEKNLLKIVIIILILTNIAGIIISVAGIKTAIKLEKLEKKINEIRFEKEYEDYVLKDTLNQ